MAKLFENAVNNAMRELRLNISKHDFRFKPKRIKPLNEHYLEKYIWNKPSFTLYQIKEGLIKTFPIEDAKKHFKDYLGIDDTQFAIVENNGVKVAYVAIPNIGENRAIVEKGMQFYGYYLAEIGKVPDKWQEYYNRDNVEKVEYIQLLFEPKFQKSYTSEEIGTNILYHITTTKHLDKIMKMGLCPRYNSTTEIFPDRVYLLGGKGAKYYINHLAYELSIYKHKGNQDKEIDTNYSLITLDTQKIDSNKSEKNKTKFYVDGNTDFGFWTYDNISPNAIIDVKPIKLDKKIIDNFINTMT